MAKLIYMPRVIRQWRSAFDASLYFGFMLFIALYSLILGISSKDRVLWIYSALTTVSTLYLLTVIGYSFPLFYPEISTINNYVRTFLMLALIPLLSFFAASFLSIRHHSPRTFNVIVTHNFAILSLVLVYFFFFFGQEGILIVFFKITYGLIITLFVCIMFFVVSHYKKQPQISLVYLLAQGSFLGGSLFQIIIEYGYINPSFFITSPVLMGSFIEIGLFSGFLFHRIHEMNRQKIAYLNELNSRQNENITSFIIGAEREREIIAGELHDNLGSDMALVRMAIEVQDKDSPLLGKFDELFKKLRDISHLMAPIELKKHSLEHNIEGLLDSYSGSFEAKVNIQSVPWMSEHQEVQLFRILQEALKNVQKHSGASELLIELEPRSKGAELRIEDNGIGIGSGKVKKGFGLGNMDARAASIGGSIDFGTSSLGHENYRSVHSARSALTPTLAQLHKDVVQVPFEVVRSNDIHVVKEPEYKTRRTDEGLNRCFEVVACTVLF